MSRIRSPGYPSIPLHEAIDIVEKIWNSVRQNTVDREAAVKDMGYTGLTGHSSKMLSNLSHFNLVEKSGKGGIRVTDIAVRILHPRDPDEKRQALREAAYNSELFGQIKEKFPDGFVSENSLRSYLMREGFADIAVAPAIRSYMETYGFLRQENAIESHDAPNQVVLNPSEKADAGVGIYHPTVRLEAPRPVEAPPSSGAKIMSAEQVVFVEASGPEQYVKLVLAGQMDDSLLEALEDYVKRQKKRLASARLPPPPGDAEYRKAQGLPPVEGADIFK
jgi:hypothetical protein